MKGLKAQGMETIFAELNRYDKALADIEFNGFKVDVEQIEKQIRINTLRINELKVQMEKAANKEFNAASPAQVSNIVFGNYDKNKKEYDNNGLCIYEPIYHWKGGKEVLKVGKTSGEVLELSDHPVAKYLSDYRKWTRANTSYFEKFLEEIDKNERVHKTYKIHGTRMFRLSGDSQQFPREDDKVEESERYGVRKCVIADEGKWLMEWDYSQIELRMLAHYTGDRNLLRAYNEGIDIHQQTSDLIGLSDSIGPKAGRQAAKTINFAAIYGAREEGLRRALKKQARMSFTLAECKDIYEGYNARFPDVKRFVEGVTNSARQTLQIKSWTGRIRHFYNKTEANTAVHSLISGAAAEVLRYTITNLYTIMQREHEFPAPKAVMTVHDSILFEGEWGSEGYWSKVIHDVMSDWDFQIPIEADGKIGIRWSDLEKIK